MKIEVTADILIRRRKIRVDFLDGDTALALMDCLRELPNNAVVDEVSTLAGNIGDDPSHYIEFHHEEVQGDFVKAMG